MAANPIRNEVWLVDLGMVAFASFIVSSYALVVYRSLGLGLSKSAVLALATVFSASTVASAKTANPKIKLRQSARFAMANSGPLDGCTPT